MERRVRAVGLVLALHAGAAAADVPLTAAPAVPRLPLLGEHSSPSFCGPLAAYWGFAAEGHLSLVVADTVRPAIVGEFVLGLWTPEDGAGFLPPRWDSECRAATFQDARFDPGAWVLGPDPADDAQRSIADTIADADRADLVIVRKAQRRLLLMREGRELASFRVAFGRNPEGHKQAEGDGRTPEGRYVLDYKKEDSSYHRAIHVSYPGAEDRARAAALGESPGGLIMVHGQKNGSGWLAPLRQLFDWTNGCIALANDDMDAVWAAVEPGTPIEIVP